MKTNPTAIFLAGAVLSFSMLPACAADVGDAASDGRDESEEVEVAEDAITGGVANFGYFIVTRRDTRKCISPICGGFYVKRVNEATTVCADGSRRAECYVSAIQLTGIGLSTREEAEFRPLVEEGKALIKARTYKKRFNGSYYGTLKANEGWRGATGSAPNGGMFYRIADNGIRCITAPCPSVSAAQLNSGESQNVTAVHLDRTDVPATTEAIDQASNALSTDDGYLMAGFLALPKCVPGSACGPFVVASEFYLRVVRREGKSCGGHTISGPTPCNAGQYCKYAPTDICGAADAPGRCAFMPEICTKIFRPVCGCDGNTYGNDCMAAAAGTSVSSLGACATP